MFSEFAPPAPLRRVIQAVWDSDDPGGRLILPDGCTDLFVALDEGPSVLGVATRAFRVPAGEPQRTFGVRFQPWAAAALLGAAAHELGGETLELAVVNPALARALGRPRDPRALVEAVARALAGQGRRFDARVERAVTELSAAPAETKVATLAQRLALSERQLERRFLADVGLAPKVFARVVRFRAAVAAAATAPSLTDAAFAAGYADQAHFCREVQRFAGMSPRQLMSDSFKRPAPSAR